jgi:hypothetical protein
MPNLPLEAVFRGETSVSEAQLEVGGLFSMLLPITNVEEPINMI